jgi:hypothetical protein
VRCRGCDRRPHEIPEYVKLAKERGGGITPAGIVAIEEGTYNPRTHAFWCTECYIKAGMPLGVA